MKTILKFYSPSCGPCKVVSKNLEQLGDIEIQNIDVNDPENEELDATYNVRTVPIVVLGEDGNIQAELKGIISADTLKEIMND